MKSLSKVILIIITFFLAGCNQYDRHLMYNIFCLKETNVLYIRGNSIYPVLDINGKMVSCNFLSSGNKNE